MKTLAAVAGGLTLGRVAVLAAEAERLRRVQERERAAELKAVEGRRQKAAAEREAILLLGRPEYRSLRHARWKDTLYQRAIRREAWQAFVDAGFRRRVEEKERHKAELQEWLVEPTEVPINLDYLPDF